MTDVSAVIERVAARLASVGGVSAVVLGGSRARGTHHVESDIDLGIYYHADHPLDVDALTTLAHELDDRGTPDAATAPGEWGPWINGGAWLQIDGYRMDWLYREIELVSQVIAQCRAGRATCDYQPGHPHGFHNHIYMAEAHHCRIVHDPTDTIAAFKSATAEYPPLLQRALIELHLWEAEFALFVASKAVSQRDHAYVAGNLFRCVACLVQVVFALNREYFLNEKGSVRLADTFPLRPTRLAETVQSVMANPGHDAPALQASIEQLTAVVTEVKDMCAAPLRDLPQIGERPPRRTSGRR